MRRAPGASRTTPVTRPTKSPAGGAPILLIATGEEPELAQARWWRPISDHWPEYAPLPHISFVPLHDPPTDDARPTPAAVLVITRATDDPADVHRLIDSLGDELLPVAVLADEPKRFARSGSSGLFAFKKDENPVVVAATLGAVMARQELLRAAEDEARLLRRFQGGLRTEMEKLQDELQLAASVQREFLPKALPPVPNLDFHVLFRPCGYVSGDIYDVLRLDENHVGFFLADAVGHGVPAALMTMVIARGLTTKVVTPDGSTLLAPAEVLRRLNEEMVDRHGNGSRFATAVYGVIDVRTRRVTLAGAGHPPPLRIRISDDPDDSSPTHTTRIETSGGLLGVFPDAQYDEATFTLAPDEMLVVHSDGFETAFPVVSADARSKKLPNHHYVEHFVRLARAWHRDGISNAMKRLGSEIDRQSGSLHQVDDLSAIAIVPTKDSALDRLFTGGTEQAHPLNQHGAHPSSNSPSRS